MIKRVKIVLAKDIINTFKFKNQANCGIKITK